MVNIENTEEFIFWLGLKVLIHKKGGRPFFNEGEIWWTSLGKNVGDEEFGKGDKFMRPVIVVRKFNSRICLCVPTSTILKSNPLYHQFEFKNQKFSALLLQIRVLDAKRFRKLKGTLPEIEFIKLKQKISELFL